MVAVGHRGLLINLETAGQGTGAAGWSAWLVCAEEIWKNENDPH